MNLTALGTAAATIACTGVAAWRWLRVSQREHYHPGRAIAVAGQWAKTQPASMVPLAAGAALWGVAGFGSPAAPALTAIAAGIAALAPRGLPIWSTEKKLAFTPRVQRLTAATAAVGAGLLAIRPDGYVLALGALAAPVLVDAAAAITKPIERSMSMRFVRRAQDTLQSTNPRVIAITGSYGKTTTKNYTAHLLSSAHQTLPTPGSFNNLLGISRSINEHLQPGTDIFVAEMGTYGPGEIDELCRYFTPHIAAIVSIGEAHLERMGSRETIVKAKSEILTRANTWVLNTDTPELAAIADTAPPGVTVVRCSASNADGADVAVIAETGGDLSVIADGKTLTTFTPSGSVHPINVAVAVAIARLEQVPDSMIAGRVSKLPTPASRGVTNRTEGGVTIIDDTFNANPTGAHAAVDNAAELAKDGGQLYVVTPGMFELGDQMYARNTALGDAVFAVPDAQLISVGGTNRAAFADAAKRHGATDRHTWFPTRPAAVEHVMGSAKPSDVVLYENDRPDHLP